MHKQRERIGYSQELRRGDTASKSSKNFETDSNSLVASGDAIPFLRGLEGEVWMRERH